MRCSDDKTNSHFAKIKSPSRNTYLLGGLWIGMLFFFTSILPNTAQAMDPSKMINCDVHHGTCTQKFKDTEIILDISPKPVKAMTDLKFTITLTGKQIVSEPFIDLGMPGMKMGPNRVLLKSNGKGVYSGTGTIVRCPSGKRIWKATVTVPNMGSAEFIFDVIY
ncbi:MAG: hypothetical protein PVH67_03025 [Desulfobacterales bacterium]|jgi:hypothetical protein